MHELGIMIHVAEQVMGIAGENELEEIEAIVLQVGKLASVVPDFLKACYPAAVDGTMLADTELIIETLPANGICGSCGKVYDVVDEKKTCPFCGGREYELISGREFMIKEIRAF